MNPTDVTSRRAFLLRIVTSAVDERDGEEIRVEDGTAVIGRDEGCTVTLADGSVSRRHARVELADDGFKVVDLGSSNGTWRGSERLTETVLKEGQQFRIGSTVFECHLAEEAVAEPPDEAEEAGADETVLIGPEDRPVIPPRPMAPARGLRVTLHHHSSFGIQEVEVERPSALMGRGDDCAVVVPERSVSRQHAKLELHDEGFLLTDMGSTNGTWVDGERIHQPTVIRPGKRFRVGNVVELTCQPLPARASSGTLVESPEPAPAAGTAEGRPETVPAAGTAEGGPETAPAGETGDGRPAAPPSTPADRPRKKGPPAAAIETLGTEQEEEQEDGAAEDMPERQPEPEKASQPQEARPSPPSVSAVPPSPPEKEPQQQDARQAPAAPPPPAPAEEEEYEELAPDQTVVMPTSMFFLEQTKPLEKEGEEVDAHSSRPFLIDDPESVWYVVEGGVDLFTVAVKGGKPSGTRNHFLGIVEGQCFFGFDIASMGLGSGFLAVVKPKTKLRRLSLSRIKEMAADPRSAKAVAAIIDTWVAGLSKSLTVDIPQEEGEIVPLEDGETVSVALNQRAGGGEHVVWVDVWSGSILFRDLATPVFSGRTTWVPLTSDTWLQPVSDEFGDLALTPRATRRIIDDPKLWEGLQVFHAVLCECEFINKKLAAVDEFIRLQDKAQHAEQAREAAYDAIGSVLRTEAATPREFLHTGGSEPIYLACKMVGDAMGFEVKDHPESSDEMTYEEQIQAIASTSGFRTRVVALRDEWWKEDHGPLLGQLEEGDSPVALLPTSATSYDAVDPRDGSRRKVDANVADEIAGFAKALYSPFPDGSLTARDVLRFGIRGLGSEFRMLLIMGILVGLLGAATPLITGKIFDSAIPQAERSQLVVFGLALFAAALSTSAFKIVQSVATLRVQGKMEYAVQSALWDRLMNLPANFFRTYSAGDLADRAGGIDAIQSLMSGAGVAAILGSFSGLFYVIVMLRYNWRLAALGVVLTFAYVGVTTFGNYLQLRHQRVEIKLKGRITGLVFNLITGVTKLRISGAEDHAFRTWAQRFAEQRRIAFSIGRIQNAITVFSSFFPILSSIAIFYFMWQLTQAGEAAGQPILTTGEFIAFNSAFGLFLAAMQALGEASLNLLRVVPIYERLQPIVTTAAEVDASKVYPGKIKGKIELSRISFRYTDDGPWIMKDLSLTIEPGEMVAFVGGSGCGKSTLMRLMLGFEQPQQGAIYYDGQDMATLDLRMLRQQMGVVLQVSRVMPTDIYRNIVGVSSRSIDEAWEAAEAAGIAEDIKLMPMKMHTYVSEGGGTLSGGQRQRLLIARAIVNKPKVIYLDEATSALDNRAQAKVTESMDRMDSTRIVIAHRLSTIINADKICYLEGGGIAEMGTYQELMEMNGLFAELARRQMA